MKLQILEMSVKLSFKIVSFATLMITVVAFIHYIDKTLKTLSNGKQPHNVLDEKEIEKEEKFYVCQELRRDEGGSNLVNDSRYCFVS